MANGSGRRGLPEGGVMSERDLFIAALQKDDPADPRTQVILHR